MNDGLLRPPTRTHSGRWDSWCQVVDLSGHRRSTSCNAIKRQRSMAGFSGRQRKLIQVAGNRGLEWWASQAITAAQVVMQLWDDDE